MGAFFGVASKRDITLDVFFGVDYHSHLGTRYAGMVMYDEDRGFQREIHSIENSAFRTKFENDLASFSGNSGIGCISDSDPQPILVRSHLGLYALCVVGSIRNARDIVESFAEQGHQFTAMSNGNVNVAELVAALINTQEDVVSGIKYAQDTIEGSLTLLIIDESGDLVAARDKLGRLPVLIGKDDAGYCVTFESFAYGKLGYEDAHELGSGEIVRVNAEGYEILSPALPDMKICAFLWVYYGYPNSNYEGVNVEVMRYRNGAIMARDERERGIMPDADYVT
ncbi:MAG: amidophosphoribosyltransferase, partial [Atopobiaceae bacterium]|nr:amidophosphoribosyltransferase [Atopobiaceae bacterium]